MADLNRFRKQKDEFFARDPHSPLTDEQKRNFTGLRYFPTNPALRFEVPIERLTRPLRATLQTSTGKQQEFRNIGRIRFAVNGAEAVLQVYENNEGLFLPFVDATAPDESYGAGRYLEPHGHGDHLHVDFNLAYNPYCAYNDQWSCPLPPKENRIAVRIEAGESKFHD